MNTSRWLPTARERPPAFGPSAGALFIASVALAAAAWGARETGGSVVPGGLLDESAHLLTALLVLWALGRTACKRFLVPALIASVAIDVDHIPERLGSDWLTAGTPRPYPHSLLTIAVFLLAGLVWRRRRDLFVGVALGVAIHLWWDLSESRAGVSLLWPFSDRSFSLPLASYALGMILVIGVGAYRVRARAGLEWAKPRGEPLGYTSSSRRPRPHVRSDLLVTGGHGSQPLTTRPAVSARAPIVRLLAGAILACLAIAWFVYRVVEGTNTGSRSSEQAGLARPDAPHSDALVWHDEFTGRKGSPPSSANWLAVSGARNGQLQYFRRSPANVSLDGAGHLVITARRETYTDSDGVMRQFTSGSIETRGLFQTRYGTLEARIEIPRGRGLWPAFWALGTDYARVGWPQSGEIDVMENTGDTAFKIRGSIHGPQTPTTANGYAIHFVKWSTVSLARGFHTYGVTWKSDRITFTLDGVPYGTVTPADLSPGQRWVFDKPFFLILTLAINADPEARPDAATRFPARMLVDWVRVYR